MSTVKPKSLSARVVLSVKKQTASRSEVSTVGLPHLSGHPRQPTGLQSEKIRASGYIYFT